MAGGISYFPGDSVEVSSNEEGFSGSYYEATVVKQLYPPNVFKVVYKNLVQETDEEARLMELVREEELRPVPPRTVVASSSGFSLGDAVDAFDNDGWWIGVVSGKKGKGSEAHYDVCFDTYGVTLAYHVSRVRPHLDYVNGKWKRSKNIKNCY